ncbi:hypothetical protein F2Q69_00004974 [Brassica cretica]|uniref:Uncharacterized protein n=1 Tax=Brassica cretica TaxID=69181 RepID=A0A8S9PEE8_BRACR|nr:hypothetical protein F2Q69_00004974 [Brassica cretica]
MDLKPPLQNVIDGAPHPSSNNSSSLMSTQPTVTPDPRWPSKCRWSSPPASTSTLSIEEKIAGSELSSTPSAVSDGNEDMRNQIDAVDLELNPKDSKITSLENKTEEIVSAVESTLEVAGDNVTAPEITNQPVDDRNTCVPHSRSPQSTVLPPITTTFPEISVDSTRAWAKPLAFTPPATPPASATPSGCGVEPVE